MNVNPSERRGTVFSAFTLCDDLGKGLGPSFATRLLEAPANRSIAQQVARFSLSSADLHSGCCLGVNRWKTPSFLHGICSLVGQRLGSRFLIACNFGRNSSGIQFSGGAIVSQLRHSLHADAARGDSILPTKKM